MKVVFMILFFSVSVFSQEPQYVQKAEIFKKIDENEPISLQIADNPPIYKGCDSGNAQDKRNCLYTQLKAIFDKKFKYPKKSEKINQRLFLMFTIDKTGHIKLERIIRCQDHLIEEAIKKIYKKIPKAIPGTYKDKPVNVSVSVAIQLTEADN